MVPIGDLKPNPRNPNKHTEEQVERVAKLIAGNGFRRPITASNQSGFITVGHCRRLSAILLKMTHVPVQYQDYENDGLEFADVVADNAAQEGSELDLSEIHKMLSDVTPFDTDLLGFIDFQFEPSIRDSEPAEIDSNAETIQCPNCGHIIK